MKMNKKVLFSMTAVVLTLVLASGVWSSNEGVASAEMKNDL